jgi:hypothetical protein
MRLETALSAQSKRIFCALFFVQAILQQPLLNLVPLAVTLGSSPSAPL